MTPRGGAAAVTPAATAAAQDEQKASVDPKIFVVVGLLIAAAVVGSFTTGLIGGSGNSGGLPDVTPVPEDETGGGGTTGDPPPPQQPVVAPPVITPPTPNNTGGLPPPPPQFKTVVPPDPRQTTGTMGIMVNTPNISSAQALSLAKFAKQTFESGGRWTGMQVVVFNNQEAAKTFLKYQALRKNAKLTPYQYQDLANQGIWNSVPAYYETQGKNGVPYYPSTNAKGWWARRNN